MSIRTTTFSVSATLRVEIDKRLQTIRDASPAAKPIAGIVGTVHAETGGEAFLLGFDREDRTPEEFLRDNGGEIFAMFMTDEQAAAFEGLHVDIRDGYLVRIETQEHE